MFLNIINALSNYPLVHIVVGDGQDELEGFVCPNSDMDGTFTLYQLDSRLNVNGWLATDLEITQC